MEGKGGGNQQLLLLPYVLANGECGASAANPSFIPFFTQWCPLFYLVRAPSTADWYCHKCGSLMGPTRSESFSSFLLPPPGGGSNTLLEL